MKLTKTWAKKFKKSDDKWMFFLSGSINCAQCVGKVEIADVDAQLLVLEGGIHISASSVVAFFAAKDVAPVPGPIPLVEDPAGPAPHLN